MYLDIMKVRLEACLLRFSCQRILVLYAVGKNNLADENTLPCKAETAGFNAVVAFREIHSGHNMFVFLSFLLSDEKTHSYF